MLKYLLAGMLVVAAALGSNVQAATKKGPNGGVISVTQGHPIEFVHTATDIAFFVDDDDGTPFPSKNLTRGVATIQDAGKTIRVTLSSEPPNKLVGKIQAPLSPKARIVVSIDLIDDGHKHTLQARFGAN